MHFWLLLHWTSDFKIKINQNHWPEQVKEMHCHVELSRSKEFGALKHVLSHLPYHDDDEPGMHCKGVVFLNTQ